LRFRRADDMVEAVRKRRQNGWGNVNNPREAWQSAVDNLEAFLEHLREEGVREIEIHPPRDRALGESPPFDEEAARRGLEEIAARVADCTLCPLHKTRSRTVPGQGAVHPEIAFIGEGPGAEEDAQGLAFVGRAGQLLTKMIEAMGLTRDDVFIGNIVKCRPPENRAPLPDEMDACLPYLREQLARIQPRVIVALGGTAVKGLLGVETGITKLRGQWMTFQGIDVMPTFHPAYLLRNPKAKRDVWEDLKDVLTRLGRERPAR